MQMALPPCLTVLPIKILTVFNPLSTNPTQWSNTLRQFVGNSRQIV